MSLTPAGLMLANKRERQIARMKARTADWWRTTRLGELPMMPGPFVAVLRKIGEDMQSLSAAGDAPKTPVQ